MDNIYIPEKLKRMISEQKYELDNIGQSESKVLIFDDKVLKIQADDLQARSEYNIMRWIDGKLPVPEVLGYVVENGISYLLMSKIKGKMSCDDEYMQNPDLLVTILADAIKKLWEIDITDCPVSWTLENKLTEAKIAVAEEKVDVENSEPETYGADGFENPEQLLNWLINNRPEEELVISHGDFCLPNIFITDNSFAGYIDLGRMGIADKWQDIALCYRSLKNNFSGMYTGKVYNDFDPCCLFEALGIKPDWDKIRYYILLDELF